jgi:hypothetical protein
MESNMLLRLAFRDRNAGSDRNRGKYTEEGSRGGSRGGYGARVRGGKSSIIPCLLTPPGHQSACASPTTPRIVGGNSLISMVLQAAALVTHVTETTVTTKVSQGMCH